MIGETEDSFSIEPTTRVQLRHVFRNKRFINFLQRARSSNAKIRGSGISLRGAAGSAASAALAGVVCGAAHRPPAAGHGVWSRFWVGVDVFLFGLVSGCRETDFLRLVQGNHFLVWVGINFLFGWPWVGCGPVFVWVGT